MSDPLSDAESALGGLIPEQAFWISCVWAVLLPYSYVGWWLEAGVEYKKGEYSLYVTSNIKMLLVLITLSSGYS